MTISPRWFWLFGIIVFATSGGVVAQVVFSGSGANPAGIQAVVDSFRTALGALNPNTAGSAGGGRREINWDGVPDSSSAPNNLAANFFNLNSPRGVVFSTPGTGFLVSATAASGTAVLFGNINPTYTTTFQTFSPQRLFTALGSNIVDVNFFVPGSTTPALSRGFGAVFTDVDAANTTSITLFDSSNNSLGQFFAPPGVNGGLSFLGIVESTTNIARVRITSGNSALGASVNDNGATNELVVMDDFIYGEPVSAVLPPTIAKSFDISPIGLSDTAVLRFTVSNPNASATLSNISFTDTLPAGLVVATPNGLLGTCGNGTITATAGSSTVSLSGLTGAPGASCTFKVNITPTTTGVKNNSVTVTAAESGPGNTSTATLTVASLSPPFIFSDFARSSIPLNGSTSLGFTITNNANIALTGVSFTDNLPSGLVVATPNGLVRTCGGGTITANPGSDTISLSGGTMPANSSCNFALVNVTGTTAGVKNNSVTVSSNETGQSNTWNASVTVVAPATIAKSFGAATLSLGGVTALTFTLTNPNTTTTLTGVGFTDPLPGGLVSSTPNGLTGTCGGTIASVPGSNTVSLSGANLAASASCTFTVNVTAIGVGPQNNVTLAVGSVEGGNGGTANASLVIAVPPAAANIPTLQEWSFVLLGLLLSIVTAFSLRRGR